jgi:hypothetical protein
MQRLGLDVKLITIPDGKHEPQDDDPKVFEMIRGEIGGFMHRVLGGAPLRISGPARLTPDMEVTRYVAVNHQNLQTRWQVNGGVITRRGNHWIEVVWLAGVKERSLTLATINDNRLVRSDRLMVGD